MSARREKATTGPPGCAVGPTLARCLRPNSGRAKGLSDGNAGAKVGVFRSGDRLATGLDRLLVQASSDCRDQLVPQLRIERRRQVARRDLSRVLTTAQLHEVEIARH